jgi:hypothetical protein
VIGVPFFSLPACQFHDSAAFPREIVLLQMRTDLCPDEYSTNMVNASAGFLPATQWVAA